MSEISRKQIACILAVLMVCSVLLTSGNARASNDINEMTKSISHYAAGLMFDWYGLTDDAIEEYKQASEFDRDSYIIHLRLGANYIRDEEYDKAIKELQIASRLKPDELQPNYLLALIYSTKKDFGKAAEEYETILMNLSKTDPENVEVYGYLGQLYYSQQEYQKAVDQFSRILTLEPKNAEIMSIVGSLYLEMNKKQDAIRLFKQAIDIDPEHDGSLNSLGYLYAEEGINLDEAADLIERALAISPDNGAYLDSLGWVYYKKGMYQKALQYLEKAAAQLEDPVIFDHLGDAYNKLNEMENASKYWRRSLELLPDQESVEEKLKSLNQNL